MSDKKKVRHKNLLNSDPGKILNLVIELIDDTSAALQVKINGYLTGECDAELVFHVIIDGERMEAAIETIGSTILTRKVKILMTQKLADVYRGGVVYTDLIVNMPPEIRSLIAKELKDLKKKRITLFPISDKPFSVMIGIVEPNFTEDTTTPIVQECFMFCWPTLKKTIALEFERSLKMKCQQLLRMSRKFFTQLGSLEKLLQIAMQQAKVLMKAQYSSVMLIDVDKMQLVETTYTEGGNKETVRRFPLDKGITCEVLKAGKLINCKKPNEHPAFDPTIDAPPGVECKNILCFPIREESGIIGVGQIINKIGDPYFDIMDEEMALAISVYSGICIIHALMYQKLQEAHIRNCLANELVMYYMKVSESEVNKLLTCSGFHEHPQYNSLHMGTRTLPLRELPCYAMKMFIDLGYVQKFNIKLHKLATFLLYVKKGYRDVPYHNWIHGFSTGQWAYAAIVNYKLVQNGYFTELHALMFLIAGFVHDLDHRGTTNSFQISGQTTLAALYSSEGSVMERHHLSQAVCILNTEGCDILESLSRRDYDRALLILKEYIIASDMANFFKNLSAYQLIAADFQKGNRVHRTALQCLLMNAADLSDQLKEWGLLKKVAAAVITEFFNQGDQEKNRGDVPIVIMDRDKCFIPSLQVEFLRGVCVPLFELLSKMIPKAEQLSKIIYNHIQRWEAAIPVFAEVPLNAGLAVLLSPELDGLIEVNLEKAKQMEEEDGDTAQQQ